MSKIKYAYYSLLVYTTNSPKKHKWYNMGTIKFITFIFDFFLLEYNKAWFEF